MKDKFENLEPYLDTLRRLPFVETVEVIETDDSAEKTRADAMLVLETNRGTHRFLLQIKRTNLTYGIADGILARAAQKQPLPWFLFARYIPGPMGEYLADHDLNYVDEPGNCNVRIGRTYLATTEGKRPPEPEAAARGVRAPGYQVIFAILARPDLVDAPTRTLAEVAGVGRNTAARALHRMVAEGLITKRKPRQLLDADELLDRWLVGYKDVVRPRLVIGRFRTPETDIAALEERIEAVLGAEKWAWGGGAAAYRLTRRYHGPTTVVHVERERPDLLTELRALRASDGPLLLLRTPGPIGLAGPQPHMANPVLIHVELYAEGGDRAREAAQEIRGNYFPSYR